MKGVTRLLFLLPLWHITRAVCAVQLPAFKREQNRAGIAISVGATLHKTEPTFQNYGEPQSVELLSSGQTEKEATIDNDSIKKTASTLRHDFRDEDRSYVASMQ